MYCSTEWNIVGTLISWIHPKHDSAIIFTISKKLGVNFVKIL